MQPKDIRQCTLKDGSLIPIRGRKKPHKNVKRDRERLETFLNTKCFVCITPGQIPSRRLSCCSKRVHEHCLLKCFRNDSRVQPRCPHCRQDIYPVNVGESPPSHIPEGGYLFRFQYETFSPRSLEELAEESWDYTPFLVPPPGWSEYRRRWRVNFEGAR